MGVSRDDDAEAKDLTDEDYAYLLDALAGVTEEPPEPDRACGLALQGADEEKVRSGLADVRADVFRTGRVVGRGVVIAAAARHQLSAVETAMLEVRAEEERLLPADADDSGEQSEDPEVGTVESRRGQEAAFSRAIKLGDAAAAVLERGDARIGEELECRLKALIAEGQRDKASFVRSNLGLVAHMAGSFVGQGLEYLDLVQEGTLGLLTAVERFDWTLGYSFSTYATWWIRQAMERAVANQGRAIRIPVHMVERIRRLKREIRRLGISLKREPTSEEIGRTLGVDPADVEYLRHLDAELISLDSPVGEEADSATLGEMQPSRAEPVEEEVERHLLVEVLDDALEKLTPRQREIMIRRFGLDDGVPDTLEQIGQDFGVTRERIRQIESQCLKKLRRLREFAGWFDEEEK